MNIDKGMVVYAALSGEEIVGVFTSREVAEGAGADSVEEISLLRMEGSPAAERYVCMAKGIWSVVNRVGDSFEAEDYDIGPHWGENAQSAIAALLGTRMTRRQVTMTDFFIYELNCDCSGGVENLAQTGIFKGILWEMSAGTEPEAGLISADHIARYFEIIAAEKERAKKASSKQLKLISDCLMKIAIKKASERGVIRCGTPLTRDQERMEQKLCHCFTLRELQILAVAMKLEKNSEIYAEMESGAITRDEIRKLMETAKSCMPTVISYRYPHGNYS